MVKCFDFIFRLSFFLQLCIDRIDIDIEVNIFVLKCFDFIFRLSVFFYFVSHP